MTAVRRHLWLGVCVVLLVLAGTGAVMLSRRPQRLLYVVEDSRGSPLTMPVYKALERNRRVFEEVAAFAPAGPVIASARGRSALAAGEMVSGNFFSVLGTGMRKTGMRIGGPFNAGDVERHMPVAVLSLDLWTKLFHRDPGALGQAVYLDGVPFAVFGVAAEGFSGPDAGRPVDYWIPLDAATEPNPMAGHPLRVRVITRLADGITPEAATREAARLATPPTAELMLAPVKGSMRNSQ